MNSSKALKDKNDKIGYLHQSIKWLCLLPERVVVKVVVNVLPF